MVKETIITLVLPVEDYTSWSFGIGIMILDQHWGWNL